MTHKLKENLPTIEILLGFCIYVYFVTQNTLSFAIVSLIFFIYIWLFTNIILNKYSLSSFINLISFSGIMVSITLFFMFGVEEIPYPEGAIIFHVEGLIKSLLLFFFSSLPLILAKNKSKIFNILSGPSSSSETSKEPGYDKEQWEEASLEDVRSGTFESI